MKRVMEMTFGDIALTKSAVFLATAFLVGLIASHWPFQVLLFLIQNKWWFLAAALIVSLPVMKKFFKSNIVKGTSKKKRSRKKR